jgi:hypothetical protein
MFTLPAASPTAIFSTGIRRGDRTGLREYDAARLGHEPLLDGQWLDAADRRLAALSPEHHIPGGDHELQRSGDELRRCRLHHEQRCGSGRSGLRGHSQDADKRTQYVLGRARHRKVGRITIQIPFSLGCHTVYVRAWGNLGVDGNANGAYGRICMGAANQVCKFAMGALSGL